MGLTGFNRARRETEAKVARTADELLEEDAEGTAAMDGEQPAEDTGIEEDVTAADTEVLDEQTADPVTDLPDPGTDAQPTEIALEAEAGPEPAPAKLPPRPRKAKK